MHEIKSKITGKVWLVEVEIDEEIEDGDTVIVLESMKMEVPVDSEEDGVVKEIKVKVGDTVKEGDILVVLE